MAAPLTVDQKIRLSMEFAAAEKAAAVAVDPRLARPPAGKQCTRTYIAANGQKVTDYNGMINWDGYCVPKIEAEKTVKPFIGKPCTGGDRNQGYYTGKYAWDREPKYGVKCVVNQGACSPPEGGMYDIRGTCVPGSTLSKPTIDDPAVATVSQAATPGGGMLLAGFGGSKLMLIGVGVAALAFAVTKFGKKGKRSR